MMTLKNRTAPAQKGRRRRHGTVFSHYADGQRRLITAHDAREQKFPELITNHVAYT